MLVFASVQVLGLLHTVELKTRLGAVGISADLHL